MIPGGLYLFVHGNLRDYGANSKAFFYVSYQSITHKNIGCIKTQCLDTLYITLNLIVLFSI